MPSWRHWGDDMTHDESRNFRDAIADGHNRLFGLLRSGELCANRLEYAGDEAPFLSPGVIGTAGRVTDGATERMLTEAAKATDFMHHATHSMRPGRRRFWQF